MAVTGTSRSRGEYNHLMVPRVSHLDAQYLDDEIFYLLKSSLLESCRYAGASLYTACEPEFDALLRWFVLRFTLVNSHSTVGQKLLQMKYSSTVPRSLLVRFATTSVFITWIHRRLLDIVGIFSSDSSKKDIVVSWLNKLEISYKILYVINLLIFLREGYYCTPAERFWKLRPVPTIPPQLRQISYNFFSRELLWNGFADILGLLLPLIPTQKVHNAIRKFLPSYSDRRLDPDSPKDFKCCVCINSPIIPYDLNCGHVVCYYCFSVTKNNAEFHCPACRNVTWSASALVPSVALR